MTDMDDHLWRLDEQTRNLPDATDAQWQAATAYVTRRAADLLPMLGMTS